MTVSMRCMRVAAGRDSKSHPGDVPSTSSSAETTANELDREGTERPVDQ